MAVTALSGQRWQGISANSSSSWTSNTADWTYSSSGYLDFATIHRATTSQEIYLDLQDFLGGSNLSDSSWVVRLGKFTTDSLASSGNVLLYIGFTNSSGADSGETQQTIVTAFNFNPSAGAINVIATANSIESGDEAGTVYSDLDASTDYYVEMKRDGNDFTVTAYSDEYSTSLGTQTITKSGLSGLRYFKAFNNSEQSGNSATGSKFYGDVQIYDAQTSATTLTKTITLADDKTTVTDVPVGSQFEETNTRKFYQMGESNVSGTSLKAYYKMNGSSTTEIVNVASTVTGNSTLGTDANIDLINAPTPSVTGTPTNLGTSYTFNGTDELGKMGDSGDLSQWTFMHNQTASFTFNVWIKFPSGTQPVNNKYFWDNSRETDTVPSFQIRGKGGFWRVIVSQGASGGWVMSTDDNPQLDCPQDQEWHMYTFTYDYLNTPNFTYRVDANTSGTYYETKNNSSQNASNSDAPVQPYFFATQNTGGGTTGWQAGTACELAIWDRILTSAEITTLYASGDGLQLDTGLKVWTERGTAI
jgi:hypothetical protein